MFIHERHATDPQTPRLAGWWGNEPSTRFRMAETFEPGPGADGFRISTPPILSLAPIAVVTGDVRRGRDGGAAGAVPRVDRRARATGGRARARCHDRDAARPGPAWCAVDAARRRCARPGGGARRATTWSRTSASQTSSGWHRCRCTARSRTWSAPSTRFVRRPDPSCQARRPASAHATHPGPVAILRRP